VVRRIHVSSSRKTKGILLNSGFEIVIYSSSMVGSLVINKDSKNRQGAIFMPENYVNKPVLSIIYCFSGCLFWPEI
jgi:formyltetrahydrofolate synthetase